MTNVGLANDCTTHIKEHCVLLYENWVLADVADVAVCVTPILKMNQIYLGCSWHYNSARNNLQALMFVILTFRPNSQTISKVDP